MGEGAPGGRGENREGDEMSKRRRFWLKFLLFFGQRRRVVEYLRYRGLLMRDVAARRKDLRGVLS